MLRAREVEVGEQLPIEELVLTQADLVRYAGASGDYNPLHWDHDFARDVSPTGGVIAHGMLSMGHVARIVSNWAGAPERVLRLSARFRAPCPVGATLRLGGEVVEVDEDGGTAILALWAELPDGARVLDPRSSRAVVRLG